MNHPQDNNLNQNIDPQDYYLSQPNDFDLEYYESLQHFEQLPRASALDFGYSGNMPSNMKTNSRQVNYTSDKFKCFRPLPFIDYSPSQEVYNERKQRLEAELKHLKLSKFEVELFSTYPDLLPDQRNFQRHSIEFTNLLIQKNFDFVFFDVETTGMSMGANKAEGHRVIELGMIPLCDGKIYTDSDNSIDQRFNPQQSIDLESSSVHNIYNDDVKDKPLFRSIIEDFKQFVTGKVLLAHNAEFDLSFIDRELEVAGADWRLQDVCLIVDTLAIARNIHQGSRLSLDALCSRYKVSNASREYHGAHLDSILLAEVFVRMTQSYQAKIDYDNQVEETGNKFLNPVPILNLQPLTQEEIDLINNISICLSSEDLEKDNEIIKSYHKEPTAIQEIVEPEPEDDEDEYDLDMMLENGDEFI